MHQYLHTAKYGNPGGAHTMKPMFKKVDNHIFKSEYHPDVIADSNEGNKAIYHVKGDKVYAASGHPDGHDPHAIFEIRDGGKIHTTMHHAEHNPNGHVFVLNQKPDAAFIENVIKNA